LGGKRSLIPNCVVSKLVEFNAVPKFSFPTDPAGVVVGKLILLKGFKKYLFLFFVGFKNKFNSSLQIHGSYTTPIPTNSQVWSPPCFEKQGFRPQGGIL